MRRLKAIIAELFTPTLLETDTTSNKSYRRAVVAISHCVLAAAIVTSLVLFSVPYYIAAVCYLTVYTVKELIDLFECGDYADFFEDMTASVIGVLFSMSLILPVVAILIGFIVFVIHM